MNRKNLRVGDIVVITGCNYPECEVNIGKIGRIVRFIKAGAYDEDYVGSDEDSVVVESLHGTFTVLQEDDTELVTDMCAPMEKHIEFIA